jgi:hypothetical protein
VAVGEIEGGGGEGLAAEGAVAKGAGGGGGLAEHRRRGTVWERSGEHGTVQALTALLDEFFGSAINLAASTR